MPQLPLGLAVERAAAPRGRPGGPSRVPCTFGPCGALQLPPGPLLRPGRTTRGRAAARAPLSNCQACTGVLRDQRCRPETTSVQAPPTTGCCLQPSGLPRELCELATAPGQ
ncbi:hypothetical protein J0S82_013682 [Galemys pyrenaicus]|uniref:Uncharacterized protein n=1 Tax=Galemys pyrenaicus TaxID=202257 RepID=A0A8J6DD29_GALPY|nr:hypothetical protein J0S82_013682 [Galemys pyrenaicus]